MTEAVACLIVDDLTTATSILAAPSSGGSWHIPHTVDMAVTDGTSVQKVLAELMAQRAGHPVTVGEEHTSQIGPWPQGDGTDLRMFLATLHHPDQLPARASWLTAEETRGLTWVDGHHAAIQALRNTIVMQQTRPSWKDQVTLPTGQVLRPLQREDLPGLAKLWSNQNITRNLGHDALNLAHAELYVRGRLKEAQAGTHIPLVVADPDSGEVIGDARIVPSPRWSCHGATGDWNASVGYSVRTEWQSKGIGTATLEALTTICFDTLNIQTVRATVFEQAQASAHIMEKCGYSRTGSSPDAFADVDGTLIEDYHYTQTQAHWNQR